MKEVEDMMPTFADYKTEIDRLTRELAEKHALLTEVREAHQELLDQLESKHAKLTEVTEMKQMLVEENTRLNRQAMFLIEHPHFPEFMKVLLQRMDPKKAYLGAMEAIELMKTRPDPDTLRQSFLASMPKLEGTPMPKKRKNGTSSNEVT